MDEPVVIDCGADFRLTDAINLLAQEQSVYAYVHEGPMYDVGKKLDYLAATIELAPTAPNRNVRPLEARRDSDMPARPTVWSHPGVDAIPAAKSDISSVPTEHNPIASAGGTNVSGSG